MAHSHVISLLQAAFPRGEVRLASPEERRTWGLCPAFIVDFSDYDGSATWLLAPDAQWRAIPIDDDVGHLSCQFSAALASHFDYFEYSYLRKWDSAMPPAFPAIPYFAKDLDTALSLPDDFPVSGIGSLGQRRKDIVRRLSELTATHPESWVRRSNSFSWSLGFARLELQYDDGLEQLRSISVASDHSCMPVGPCLEDAIASLRRLRDMALLIERTMNPASEEKDHG